MRSVIIVIYLGIFFIFYLPLLLFAVLLGYFNKKLQYKFTFRVGKHWSKVLIFLAGTKVKVKGIDKIPKGPVLYVGNHRSWFDIPIVYSNMLYPAAFVSKKEVEKVPVLSTWMKCIDCLFLDRKDIRAGMKTILRGIELLKKGHSIIIFPQGTRCKDEEILPFKQGSLKLAKKSGVPIIPVAIKNSDYILEKNGLNVKSVSVNITFGKPILLDELSPIDKKNSAKYIQNKILSMLNE